MPHSNGYRARTRHSFSRKFREKGVLNLTNFMRVYKLGDYVDIKVNAAQQKGMPHKFYHGRTGIVYNVAPHAVGVEVNKEVNGRIMKKRINVRVEHVNHSKCRVDFLNRVKQNELAKKEAKKTGVKVQLKRLPAQPRAGRIVSAKATGVKTISPLPFEILI